MTPPSAPPRRERVRQAWTGIRTERPPTDGERSALGDPAVLDLVADPYADVADATRRLRALERTFRERGDRRAVFLGIYSRMTAEVGAGIDGGEFEDPDWTAEYLVAFAELYREALYAYETGDLANVADPWQIAFETSVRGDSLVVQDAALGINAHVNYDLAWALSRVGIDPDREMRYADHQAVDDVLHRLVDDVQDDLAERYAPGIANLDDSLGRLDEYLSVFAIAQGRESAWRTAVALADSRTGIRARFARWVTRVTSTGAAHLIASSRAIGPVHDALREVEAGSAADQPGETTGTNDGTDGETDG